MANQTNNTLSSETCVSSSDDVDSIKDIKGGQETTVETTGEVTNKAVSKNDLFCDCCKENGIAVPSSRTCRTCEESYCDDCSSVHRSQKATRQHVLDLLTGTTKAVFLCNACIFYRVQSPATSSCKECEELYCDSCSKVHKTQKATRHHTILQHDGLAMRSECEPCIYNGQKNVTVLHICVDCDEVLCQNCSTVHTKQKATRNHAVICATQANVCQLCKQVEKESKSEKYCSPCSVQLCYDCITTHAQNTSTTDHEILDISAPKGNLPQPVVETSTLKFVDSKVIKADEDMDTVVKLSLTKPGKPCVVRSVHADSICLAWESPKKIFEEYSYQLRYKEASTDAKWSFHPQLATKSTLTLSNLKSNTEYVFQVRMVCDESEGPYSEVSDAVRTIESAAHQLLNFMYDVKVPNVNIPLKKIPLQENFKARNVEGKTRKLVVGDVLETNAKEKTIMLVGSTGTGKSTLVDGMINYILGVNWTDSYRLTLVDLEDDERNIGGNQAVSQTQWITCYVINPIKGSRLDYKLNIIDTPGFGDTRGIERDKEIIEQIRVLFSSIDERGITFIDAVCFLVKAPDARLTPTQMYIFNAIMSLFGHDIKDNICMLVTFADGKPPPVLSALKEAHLLYEQFFPFNNSGLFAENSGESVSSFSPMFWDMGCTSFQKFFDKLSLLETKSLTLTRNVLEKRKAIELTTENLLQKLDAGLNKVEELRVEIKIFEEFKTQIEDNKDFTYSVNETQQTKLDLPKGTHVTNCLNCHMTCHKNCAYANDEDKKKCCAMDRNGYCTQCNDNCFWEIHKNTSYIFEYVTVKKEKTYEEKLKKYRRAENETMTREKVVERMHEELREIENDITEQMEIINDCNNILREIALRQDPLSVVEHIDLLIQGEKQEKRPGFQARIVSLQQCRKKATFRDDVDRFRIDLTNTTTTITPETGKNPTRIKQLRKKLNNILQNFTSQDMPFV